MMHPRRSPVVGPEAEPPPTPAGVRDVHDDECAAVDRAL
jgi:hypothetical protein